MKKSEKEQIKSENMQEDIEMVKSGEVNKIYPVLKPGDWVGIEKGCIKQTLLGTQEDPKLVVAFAYDAPSNYIFLTHKDVAKKDPNEVLNEAYSNIDKYEAEFEVSEVLEGKILTASGKDFSSEKLLCEDYLNKAHEMLDAEELLVSIPRRTCMMVANRKSNNKLLNGFVHLHKNAWEDDSYGHAPIINALFVIKNGQIEGAIPMDEQEQN